MHIVLLSQIPVGIVILIFVPYFVAVIAAINYTNKQIRKAVTRKKVAAKT